MVAMVELFASPTPLVNEPPRMPLGKCPDAAYAIPSEPPFCSSWGVSTFCARFVLSDRIRPKFESRATVCVWSGPHGTGRQADRSTRLRLCDASVNMS